MSFYNLSFFEAAKLFERPSSKQGFARRTKDFPALSSQPQNKIVRRQTPTGGYSYNLIVKRKRLSTPPSQGYDRTAHKQALLPSTSRINSSPLRSYHKSTSEPEMEVSTQGNSWAEICNRFDNFKNENMSIKNLDRDSLRNIKHFFDSADLRRRAAQRQYLTFQGEGNK